MTITKEIIVNENGDPKAVIIPWAQFKEIEETLGLDLEPEVIDQLKKAAAARKAGDDSAYASLDDL